MAVSRINEAGLNVNQYGNRNLVINGAMQVFQRATAATTASNNTYQTADRWKIFESTDGAYTTERSTDTPSGTGYSLKAIVTTADTSIAATQYASIEHYIEAQNLQQLEYGTSSAKTLTLSFFVKSNKTGTYTIALYKPDTTGYMFTKEYTIDSANTWEKKTIIITPTAGSTSFITSSGGAIANDNGIGLGLSFNLVWGSNFNGGTSGAWSATVANYSTTNAVNWMDTVGNTLLISEVQLEVGDTATDFEHRTFADELIKCQRYFCFSNVGDAANEPIGGFLGMAENTTRLDSQWTFPVQMRATPTMTKEANYIIRVNSNQTITSASFDSTNRGSTWILSTGSFVDKEAGRVYTSAAGPAFSADAEL